MSGQKTIADDGTGSDSEDDPLAAMAIKISMEKVASVWISNQWRKQLQTTEAVEFKLMVDNDLDFSMITHHLCSH